MAIHIEQLSSSLQVAFVWTMLDPGYLDLAATSTIKVEKILVCLNS